MSHPVAPNARQARKTAPGSRGPIHERRHTSPRPERTPSARKGPSGGRRRRRRAPGVPKTPAGAKMGLTAFSHVQGQERLLDLQGAALETHVPPLRHSGFYYIGKVPETPPSPTAPRRRATPERLRVYSRRRYFGTDQNRFARPTHPKERLTRSHPRKGAPPEEGALPLRAPPHK